MADNVTTVAALSGDTSATTLYIAGASQVAYEITGGADRNLFTLGSEGNMLPSARLLAFAQRPDFAHPSDVGGDNTYEVEVTATYGGISQSTLYKVQVVDDDYRGDASTTATISNMGVPIYGRIDTANDRDWFRFEATGSSYLLLLRGASSYEIRSADGSMRQSTGGSQSMLFQFLDLPVGSYYLSVGTPGNWSATGQYAVSLSPSAPGGVNGNQSDDIRTGTALADLIFGNGGDDTLNGAGGNDVLDGGEGNDTLNGGAGDDVLVGRAGNNRLDGGEGYDVAIFTGQRSNYTVIATSQGWEVRSRESVDLLTNMEALEFSDRLAAPIEQFIQVPGTLSTQIENILRGTATSSNNIALATRVASDLATGALTAQAALQEVVKAADATTTVATLSYQFFTGKIPTAAGIDFLVSATGPNPSNLNSALYAKFDTVNRFINFAANLGKYGEAKDSFAAKYGTMTLAQATKDAYAIIFGATPSEAKVAALLNGRVDYLASFTGDTATGLGTKAAMVGFLLAAAATENVGLYAKASDAFLTDLGDGASFGIDLVGVYGKADYAYGG